MRFTRFNTDVELLLPPGADAERAKQLLHKAELSEPCIQIGIIPSYWMSLHRRRLGASDHD